MADPLLSRKSSTMTREKIRLMATTDPWLFALELYREAPANALNWAFHGELIRFMLATEYDENLYLAFRGSFKTSLITILRNVQRILAPANHPVFKGHPCGPNVRILIAHAVSTKAEEILGGIKAHLKHPLVLWAFPDILGKDPEKLPKWTSSEITVLRSNKTLIDCTARAVGVTTEMTGQHWDHGTFDDVVAKENSQTQEGREGVKEFRRRVRPLFDPGSTVDNVGTCWHYADHWADMLVQIANGAPIGLYQKPAWEPAEPDTPGAVLVPGFGWVRATFPERFPIPWLLKERELQGSAFFASQYLLDPVSRDTAYLKREKLDIVTHSPPLEDLWLAMAVDPASSLEKWGNFTGIAVGGFDPTGDLWLLEVLREKRDDLSLVRLLYDLQRRFPRFMVVGFEAMGFAKTYRRLFVLEGERRGAYLNVVGLTRTPKRTKNDVIAGLQAHWEGGHIHALSSCRDLASLLDEADTFRPETESRHDDLLDAVVDLYELRSRPGTPRPPDTPETAQRRFEDLLNEERITRGQAPLDAMSLSAATLIERAGSPGEGHYDY